MKPGQRLIIESLTANVTAVTMDKPVWLNNMLKLDGCRFYYFRDAKNGGKTEYCYIAVPPYELTPEDVEAINLRFDQNENSRNVDAKKLVAHSLTRHFNGRGFHLYEPGCGVHPLLEHFSGADISYHGIESDPACVASLRSKGILSSDWDEALKRGTPDSKPTVSAAIYALHFLVNDKLPENIKGLTSAGEGFFIGNYYVDPHEKRTGAGRKQLSGILTQNGLSAIVLKGSKDPNNEYWIIGRIEDKTALESYAATLRNSFKDMRGQSTRRLSR